MRHTIFIKAMTTASFKKIQAFSSNLTGSLNTLFFHNLTEKSLIYWTVSDNKMLAFSTVSNKKMVILNSSNSRFHIKRTDKSSDEFVRLGVKTRRTSCHKLTSRRTTDVQADKI